MAMSVSSGPGVLVVFSTEPRAFGESETAALLLLTRLMVEILSGEPVGREIGTPLLSADAATGPKVPEVLAAVGTLDKDKSPEIKAASECRHCLFRNPLGTQFCARCGVPLNSPAAVSSGDKRTTASQEMDTNSAEAPKATVEDEHETAKPTFACGEQNAEVSWEHLSNEIIASFDGFAVSNPTIPSVSLPPVAVSPPASDAQSPVSKPPLASKNGAYSGRRITKWLRNVAG